MDDPTGRTEERKHFMHLNTKENYQLNRSSVPSLHILVRHPPCPRGSLTDAALGEFGKGESPRVTYSGTIAFKAPSTEWTGKVLTGPR